MELAGQWVRLGRGSVWVIVENWVVRLECLVTGGDCWPRWVVVGMRVVAWVGSSVGWAR
jgi:hypothetical protein